MIIITSYSNVSVTYIANGTQTVFSFPFDYLRKAFVLVEVNEETILTQGTDYNVSGKTVVFTTAPTAGTVLRIYRQTDTSRLVSWADASVLRAKDMTIQQVQELHLWEENRYWVQENAIIRNGHQWNARNFPIKNVGDPVDAKDATNKEYVDNNFMKLDDNGDYWVGRGKTLRDIEEPIRQSDGATKNYVDRVLAGLSITGDRVQTFNSVALMKEAPLEPGMVAMTTGYHNSNDGGASVYTVRTKTQEDVDDGGSIIFLDNGNVAELITDGTVNVKQFGAKGDGVTDDTTAIQSAISFGKKVYIPNDETFLTTDTIIGHSNLHIYGNGTIKFTLAEQKNCISFTAKSNVVVEGLTIINTEIVYDNAQHDGNGSRNHQSGLCFYDGCEHIRVKNVTIKKFSFAQLWMNEVTDFIADGCVLISLTSDDSPSMINGANHNFGIKCNVGSIKDSIYCNNIIKYGSQGIYIGRITQNLKICGNKIEDIIGQHCFYVNAPCEIYSNTLIASNDNNGINIQYASTTVNDTKVVSIHDNVIKGCANGIALNSVDSSHIKVPIADISGNCIDGATNGMTIAYANDTVIHDNTITNVKNSGIVISHVNNTTIANNVITNFGLAGVTNNQWGIYISTEITTRFALIGNVILGDGTHGAACIYCIHNPGSYADIIGNTFQFGASWDMRFADSYAIKKFEQNIYSSYYNNRLPTSA